MTYNMTDAWALAQRAVNPNDPLCGQFYDALLNVFLEDQKRHHPTYNNTVQKIAAINDKIENSGIVIGLVREIFGLNARDIEYQYELRDAEYEELKEIGRLASQQFGDILSKARRIQWGLPPDDDDPYPGQPLRPF